MMLSGYKFWQEVLNSPRYVATPLLNIGSLPFHLLCRQYGVTLCFSPAYNSSAFLKDTSCREYFLAAAVPSNRPLIVQFHSSNIENFISAAKLVTPYCDAVQLNLDYNFSGINEDSRTSMTEEWDKVEGIVKKASKELCVPLTCKMKVSSGLSKISVEFARKLESLGFSFLVIQSSDKTEGMQFWETVKQIKQKLTRPVIIETKIYSFQDVQECFKYTGVDAILGSESLAHNPAVFTGTNPFVWDVAEKYLLLAEQHNTPLKYVKTYLFKIMHYSLQHFPEIRRQLCKSNSFPQFHAVCDLMKDHLLQLAKQQCNHNSGSGSADVHLELMFNRIKINSSEKIPESMLTDRTKPCLEKEKKEKAGCDLVNNIDISLQRHKENCNALCLFGVNMYAVDSSNYSLPVWLCHWRPKASLQNSCGCNSDPEDASQPLSCVNSRYLSKNCLRKMKRYTHILEHKKNRRKLERSRRKSRKAEMNQIQEETNSQTSHSARSPNSKMIIRERLLMARGRAPIVCVDFSFCHLMSEKEKSRLASQLCRLYGSNRKSSKPLNLYFSSLNPIDDLYKICCKKNNGFASYVIEMNEKSYLDLFDRGDIIYLTPDSDDILYNIDVNKVYIIGGLVDETVHKGITLQKAREARVTTSRLPIRELLERKSFGSFSTVLTVNQVFDILLVMHETEDWTRALCAGVPSRKGFKVTS